MINKILITLLIILTFIGCDKKETTDNIVIGAILPLTGNASQIGQWQKKGIELAISEINSHNDRKIEVIFKDSMSSPKNGILAYRNLIENNQIKTVISSLTSVSSAIQSSSEKDKKELIMLAVSHPTITNDKKYSIRFNLGSEDESFKLAEYLKKENYKSVCNIYINNDFGLMASNSLENNYKNVILKNAYSPKDTDFRTLSKKIIDTKCEAVNVIGYTSASILLIKQLHEQGAKQHIFTNMALSIPSFQKLGGESLKNVRYTATEFENKINLKSNDFIVNYKNIYHENPTFFASFSYDALNFIYKNKIKNIPLTTNHIYNYDGSIGKIEIKQGKLKTNVSINKF